MLNLETVFLRRISVAPGRACECRRDGGIALFFFWPLKMKNLKSSRYRLLLLQGGGGVGSPSRANR